MQNRTTIFWIVCLVVRWEPLSWVQRFQDLKGRGEVAEDDELESLTIEETQQMAKKATKRKKASTMKPELIKPGETEEIGRDGEGKKRLTVSILPVVCPRCKSTKRAPFKEGRVRVRDYPMRQEPTLGVYYNRIIWRRTECLDCGQKMTVREFTIRPGS